MGDAKQTKPNETAHYESGLGGGKKLFKIQKIEQKIIKLFKLFRFFFFFLSSSYMSSISCACHIMKLARDSFRLKSESVYGRSESWPTCFLNAGGKKKKTNKTERRSSNKPSAKVPGVSFSEAGSAVIHA